MKKYPGFRGFSYGLWAAVLALCAPSAMAQRVDPPASHPFAQSQAIAGRYIVVFKNSVSNPAAEAANVMRGQGGQIHHIYATALKGFAASVADAALQGLRNHPLVDYIEQDQTVALSQLSSPQDQATWGLDRIDQADRPLDSQYHFNYSGAGVHAFIIDTGIRPDHVEFSGRLLPGYSVVKDANGTSDCNGHGTHVAGTVGATTWGVAKAVALIPVRVLNCKGSGSWSDVIAGVDWVASSTLRPAAANMSLGGGASASVNAAVAGAVSKGVTMVVAAGNSNADACNYSPAGEPSAITVGATTIDDWRASYSNYGSCLDIFAPGSSITSAWNTSSTASNTISGTSMAAPHATGVAVLALVANPGASPAAVAAFLIANATANRLSAIGAGSPNLLTYSLADGAPTEPPLQVVAVRSLEGSATAYVNGWRAHVTVTLGDPTNNYAAVANATVQGSFSPGGTASCVTASSGSCTLNSGKIKPNTDATVMTVSNVSGSGLSYDPGGNLAVQITVTKP